MNQIEFSRSVKDALNHFHDAAYLENHVLIQYLLNEDELNQVNRVQVLRNKLKEGINYLRAGANAQGEEELPADKLQDRSYLTLTYRYLRKMDMHRIEDDLGLSNRQVQRELKKGLDAVVSLLWNQRTGPFETAGLAEGGQRSQELESIHEELKSWEIQHNPCLLTEVIEQALQLRKTTAPPAAVDVAGVEVFIDFVLTKQGLYKLFDLFRSEAELLPFQIHSRKLNERFIELTIQCESDHPVNAGDWEIAVLFFNLQGLKVEKIRQDRLTTVSITLPLKQQYSCIVVDDVPSVHRLIERFLGPYGIQVFGAANYREAIDLAQTIKPDFILLDILMPEMDGWQVLKTFKQNSETAQIPILISSVLYEPELAQEVGAAAYIRKPIHRPELLDILHEKGFIETI